MIYAKGILQKNCQTITQKDNEAKMTQFEYRHPDRHPFGHLVTPDRQFAAVLLP